MRRIALALLAASSLLCGGAMQAATRPHYGGTLRVATRVASSSLDPLDTFQSGALESANLSFTNISSLIFDTLVTLDDRGRPQPALAISWEQESEGQRWQVKLRQGVTFHDGTPMTAEQVASSLRVANPDWKVLSAGGEITIELDSPFPDLPAELASSRNGIAKRGGVNILGTGPFSISQWQAEKKLTLTANNDYWGGRPFVDGIEITMAMGFREQAISLELGKSDLIEIAPEQARQVAGDDRHVENSAAAELMALVFVRPPQSADQSRLRQALALSIDRAALSSVFLQGGGEPAGGLLPNWMTGYEFLFLTTANPAQARQVRDQLQSPAWTLAYDSIDPVARAVAERIVLNARDAGIAIQLSSGNNADMRLVRTPILSLNPRVALRSITDSYRLPPPKVTDDTSEAVYAAESLLLNSRQVIPLLHLRASYAMNAKVKNWSEAPTGSSHLSEVWLATDK